MIYSQAVASEHGSLSRDQIVEVLARGLADDFRNQRVLVLIPDHTRSLPLPFFFRTLVEILREASQLSFMVALGTHPPLSQENLNRLTGISTQERMNTYRHVQLLNHQWHEPTALACIGRLEPDEVRQIAGSSWHPSLPDQVEIRINRAALEADQVLILGPTFPHEVVGFSGGSKYLFPGISGADMINITHWLGALAGVVGTIGIQDTPVRAMIESAARRLSTPVRLIALTVKENEVTGMFIGDRESAWKAAADLSAQQHIRWCDKPFQRVLSCAPPMYDELWTAAKAMYKLEPAVAVGGEVIIYAPQLEVISQVHGKSIEQAGYHILPYFLDNWECYRHIPLGVLAHCVHLRGSGRMENGIERPNVKVTLASKIPQEVCNRLNLGYLDPAAIDPDTWREREAEGLLMVPHAGEELYRLRPH